MVPRREANRCLTIDSALGAQDYEFRTTGEIRENRLCRGTHHDYDDGNWLLVAAHCGEAGASVWAEGALLQAQNIAGLGKDCEKLLSGAAKKGALETHEPNLHVAIEAADHLGHFRMTVQITPNHLTQEHRFEFEIDQSYLPSIIEQCRRLTEKFPVRGV